MSAEPWPHDLTARLALRDERRLRALGAGRGAEPESPETEDAALRERLDEVLEASFVAGAYREASRTPPTEPARRRFRLLATAYLERSAREVDASIAGLLRRAPETPETLELSLSSVSDPVERQRIFALWKNVEDTLEPQRAERRQVRLTAAREAGAVDLLDFFSAAHPVPPRDVLREFTRCAVEPLDDRVTTRARERRARFRPPFDGPPAPAEVPALAGLSDHRADAPLQIGAPLLRRLGKAIGMDPDAGRGPEIVSVAAPAVFSEALEARGRPAVVLGGRGGLAALARALGSFGRAARALSSRAVPGPAGALGRDPAFPTASEALFRRLLLSERFEQWAGLSLAESARADLRFEEALGPRSAWALLLLACEGASGASDYVREVLTRAAGRPPAPDLVARTWESDPQGAAVLRGTALAVLLEERLMTRFGRAWFQDRHSGAFLREIWESEPDETAENVARALDLGTMEGQLIADTYQP